MLIVERHREILSRVNREGSARVTELARLLQVTEETIRRDLEKLEVEGRLLRSHGGAVTVKSDTRELPFSVRQVSQEQEKIAIAAAAVCHVSEGDTLFIDASTTAWQFARVLPDIRVTVLTNAIKVVLELASRARARVICTGGALSTAPMALVGPSAERILEDYHVDKVFFSAKAVDLERGLSDANEIHATLKRRMLAIADQRILLADHTKFGVNALTVFGRLAEVTHVITDRRIDPAVLKELRKMRLKVSVA